MNLTTLLDRLPLLAVLIGTALLALLAMEIGFRLGRSWQRRTHVEKEGPVGALAGATLGLLAFLLAFVTSMAVQRFDHRRMLVVDEANAISGTFLNAGFLDQPARSQARVLLREYVDIRLNAAADLTQISQTQVRSEQIQTELWTQIEPIARANQTPMMALYVTALSNMMDIHVERADAIRSSHLPSSLWLGLYAIAMLTMGLVGVQVSYTERRNWTSLIILVMVFSLVLTLIVDLDRPTQGIMVISQQAMLDLQAQMKAVMP